MASLVSTIEHSTEKRPASYDKYTFTLSDLYRKLAREELGEDDGVREQSLAQMRDWIATHQHIRKCRTDAKFLLRFLRYEKFSVPAACETLERYLSFRETFPRWCKNLDCNEVTMKEKLLDGMYSMLGHNKQGHMVVMVRVTKLNPAKYPPLPQYRCIALLFEALLEMEEVQIAGIRVMIDFKDSTLQHYVTWNAVEIKTSMNAYNRTYPLHIRDIHCVNLPSFAVSTINLSFSFLHTKIKENIHCHKSMEEWKSYCDPDLLPKDYDGKLDLDNVRRKFQTHIEERRNVVMALDGMDIDKTAYSALWDQSNLVQDVVTGDVTGSFRKLNVD